jgi:hypothetical protein
MARWVAGRVARRVTGNFGAEKRFLEFAKKCRDFVAYEKMLKIWFFIIPSVVALEQDEGEGIKTNRQQTHAPQILMTPPHSAQPNQRYL